jgi:hypothetical protein
MACILQSGASTILSRDMAALPGEAEANASGVACACRHRVEEIASADVLTAGGGACDGARWRATSGATESLLRQVIAWRFVAWWVINDRGISGRLSRVSAAPTSTHFTYTTQLPSNTTLIHVKTLNLIPVVYFGSNERLSTLCYSKR